jgi:hypothetical protein
MRLALARAVSRCSNARLLRADNAGGKHVALVDAVDNDLAFFVTPGPDLCVVDCDLPADPLAAARRRTALELLVTTARSCAVPHVVVASGRPGNSHVFLTVRPGRERDTVSTWCRERGLDIRDQGIRPPGTVHRDGVHRAELVSPAEPGCALAVLTARPSSDGVRRLAHALTPVILPPRIRSVIRNGHAAAGYETPSHARMGAAVAIRAQFGPRALLTQLLGDTTSPLGETFRRRPDRWQAQEVDRLWDKAGTWLQIRPARSPVDRRLVAFRAAVAAYPWRGLAGGSNIAALEAFAVVAQKAGTMAVAMALSDLAVAAGFSRDTARAVVRRLMAAGWLCLVAEHTIRLATVYQLTIPVGADVPDERRPPAGRVCADLGADLARWSALGKITMRVARTIEALGRSDVPSLAEMLGMTASAMRHHLRKLALATLIQRDGRHCVSTITKTGTDTLAVAKGVAGARDRQRVTVLETRKRRKAWLDGRVLRWVTARDPAPLGHNG